MIREKEIRPLLVPNLGQREDTGEVTVMSWPTPNGGRVQAGDIICEVESDKAIVELEAMATGILKILVPEGQKAKIGDQLALIESSPDN